MISTEITGTEFLILSLMINSSIKRKKVGHNTMLTFQEVCDQLIQLDETTLLEVLDLTSEDIVNKFQDKIEDKLEILAEDLEPDNIFNQDNE